MNINDDITIRVKVKSVKPYIRPGYAMNSFINIVKMVDSKGRLFTYFWRSADYPEVGQILTIWGIVKSQSEFRGVKDTVLTGVKVLKEG